MKKNQLLLCFPLHLVQRSLAIFGAVALLTIIGISDAKAQVQASGFGFNYFERQWVEDNTLGAGYSFYAGVWPIMQQYPGAENFQLGLPSTWMTPLGTGNEPSNFYNTIEGGLGWWGDTRFATETPKFIMGGVAFDFNQWANGTGAGSGPLRLDGHRDWNEPGGKYGVAQLSSNLLWPPDGLNMEQGANGDFLGYGYHPLPLTDVLEETYGVDFETGNQCWTLFLNTTNFRGPATFFIPTFWTETVLNDPSLEGLFLDSRPTDKNLAFAMEYADSPALIGIDATGETYAKVLPLVYPATTQNKSEVIREIKVYTKEAKWDAVQEWFDGGAIAATEFNLTETSAEDVVFDVGNWVDGAIATGEGTPLEAVIDHDLFAEKINTPDQRIAGFEWDTDVVTQVGDNFVMPEYYKLDNDVWTPITVSEVPVSTGLLTNNPTITPRPDDVPYLTPMESDCHLEDPNSPWNSPGPSSGPFKAELGDGSEVTYYWYRFIDQPSIIHANLPEEMRQNLQERVEKIHTNWSYTDNYLPDPTGGTLVGLDEGLIVEPPQGMEIGYVPIVTRQEKDTIATAITLVEQEAAIRVYPNPTQGVLTIEATDTPISSVQLFNVQGKLLATQAGLRVNRLMVQINNHPAGIYFLDVTDQNGRVARHRVVKGE